MANTIRIQRSTSTNTPTTLAQGEPAYSEDDSPNGEGELFIGTAGSTITKITTTLLTGTDGVAAQPNASAQDNQTITTGLGIDGAEAGDSGNITISFDPNELTATALAATDWLVFEDSTDSLAKKSLLSTTNLSLFNDDLGHVENVSTTLSAGTITASSYGITSDGGADDIILPDFNSTEAGLANASGGGTVNYLRADNTWATPPGGAASDSYVTHTVVDLDSGYTWAATGSAVAATTTDTLEYVSGLGVDIDVDATSDAIRVSAALDTLAVATMVTGDWIAFDNAGVSNKALISAIPLSIFNNDSAWEANDADTVLTTSTGAASWNWILDEDAMGSDSDTHVPTQQSVKAYVDNAVVGGLTHKGGYNATTNSPALDTGSPVLVLGDMYTVTVAGTFFTVEVEIGDVLISDVDSVDAAALADWTIVQANIGAASETVAGYIELATQAEMDTATDDLRAVTPLKYINSTIDGGTF